MISVSPFLLLALSGGAAAPAPVTVELAFKPVQDWNLLLPAERFTKVGDGIVFPHAGGERFAVKLEGTVLWVDRDGDGECEAKVEPMEPGETGLLVLRGKRADGSDGSYAVRLSSDGSWSYSASGVMAGELAGEKLRLIDQNNNGRFDDFGEDAMILGRGRAASFLSRVVNVGGALHELEVSADGTRVEARPYEGAVGELDLASQLDCKARMRSVVLKSAEGDLSFELSRERGAVKVPAGSYTLHSGQVALGKGTAKLSTGRMEPIQVAAGERATLDWGGPVRAEFMYSRGGDEVQIGPNDIRYFGAAGELYTSFMPLGTSPTFTVKEKETGEVLIDAQFPGNC